MSLSATCTWGLYHFWRHLFQLLTVLSGEKLLLISNLNWNGMRLYYAHRHIPIFFAFYIREYVSHFQQKFIYSFFTCCLYKLQYLCVSWIMIIRSICEFKFNLFFAPIWSWSLWGVPWREKYCEAAGTVRWLEAMLQFFVLQFSLAEIVSCLTSIEPTLGENAELELNQ